MRWQSITAGPTSSSSSALFCCCRQHAGLSQVPPHLESHPDDEPRRHSEHGDLKLRHEDVCERVIGVAVEVDWHRARQRPSGAGFWLRLRDPRVCLGGSSVVQSRPEPFTPSSRITPARPKALSGDVCRAVERGDSHAIASANFTAECRFCEGSLHDMGAARRIVTRYTVATRSAFWARAGRARRGRLALHRPSTRRYGRAHERANVVAPEGPRPLIEGTRARAGRGRGSKHAAPPQLTVSRQNA